MTDLMHPEKVKLRVSGWLGESQRAYFEQEKKSLEQAADMAAVAQLVTRT